MRSYENYDPCYPDQPVVDLYLPIWANQPSFRSRPAFVWAEDGSTHSTLTYAQLNSSAQSISSQLLIPLQRGDTVLILCSPGLQLVQILFGCQRAGLLSVPIFPPDLSLNKEHHHHLVRVLLQTKPKAAIAHQHYITNVRRYISSYAKDKQLSGLLQNLMWVSVDDIKDDIDDSMNLDSSSYNGCKPEDVYLIQYTSGATGIPKPVLVTAGSAAHNVRAARKAYDLDPNSVIVSWLPQYHDCGLMFLLLTVVSGATCVLTSPGSFVKRPRLWLELITKFKGNCTPVPSFALPLAVRRGGINQGTLPLNLSSLRNLILINEPIYRESVNEFIDTFSLVGLNSSCISPSYGLAENCTFVSTSWRKSSSFPSIPSYMKLLPSAKLSSTTSEEDDGDVMDIIIVNKETCEPVDDGIEGEIWVSSPSNATGYLGYPYLTSEVFQGRLRGRVSQSYVRTGDRGIIVGKERYLFVMGRSSDVIKIQNDREIQPHYVETAAYNSCPKLLRGGCIAAFQNAETLVIVAELQRSEEVEVRVLRRICEGIREAVLKEEKIEIGLVVLVKSGSVQKTTSGKIQRWATKDKLLGDELRTVSQTRFGDRRSLSPDLIPIVHAEKSKREKQDGRVRVIVEEGEELLLPSSKTPNRLTLLSFL
ncbi:AMP-dependent synthetase/ligase [Macleaya cordata]|uniref:AMP-dependent synthetase/ligase n=1 Tax=Macleaya cordata TaxID=56857 RepID=A0A200R7S2_MACCD|nr:AMP-dependent synthetase/ligase [Macleaya cordata]